jgi:ABC-2 type transport system permease protein
MNAGMNHRRNPNAANGAAVASTTGAPVGGNPGLDAVLRIARTQWRLMARERVAVLALLVLLLLTSVAAVTSLSRQQEVSAERARYQAQVEQEFDAQPDRHPHRMVHYGQFVFRPLNPWAAFDAGIDSFTGHTLFLEGHRQNSANFGDARQSSLLLRFGQLTPAFVLQVLAPLLLIFIGFAVVARERQSGTLKVLLAQGVRPVHFMLGKLLSMSCLALLVLLPAIVALAWKAATGDASTTYPVSLGAMHGLWLMVWCLAIVIVSSLFSGSRDALMALLALWTMTVILVPRLLPDVVAGALPLPTRLETDIAISRELKATGDSHNPNDPYFSAFRQRVLAQYGVARVEDLPVNYRGIVGMEGERLTSALFDRYAAQAAARQARQSSWVDAAAFLDPALAIRRASMIVAGTDLASYRRFMEQGERYRYNLVQSLNKLQSELVTYKDDRTPGKQNRVDHRHWQDFPPFVFEPESVKSVLQRAAAPVAILLLWLGAASLLFGLATRRLGRVAR